MEIVKHCRAKRYKMPDILKAVQLVEWHDAKPVILIFKKLRRMVQKLNLKLQNHRVVKREKGEPRKKASH